MNYKKQMVILALACAPLCGVLATNDTVTVEKPDRVIITETGGNMKVRVEGREGNANFLLERTHKSDGSIVERETDNTNFINVPFIKKKRSNSSVITEGHLPTFMVGLTSALGQPDGMDVSMGASWEFGFYPVYVHGPRLGRHVRLFSGLGVDWRNWRMTGKTRFLKQDGDVVLAPYPESAEPDFSRIKVFSIGVPLLAEWRPNNASTYSFYWNGGVLINVNTYGSLKTRYRLPEEGKQKEFTKRVHHVPLTADLFTSMGINDVGIYLRWSPCHVLQEAYAPAFTSLSVGLMISVSY